MAMKTLVHVMPWFDLARQNNHWSMQLFEQQNTYLHDRYQQSGRVAAHYTPLIGPYDSRDTDTIALHMDLIALSGIDGILFKYACPGLQPIANPSIVRNRRVRISQLVRSVQ